MKLIARIACMAALMLASTLSAAAKEDRQTLLREIASMGNQPARVDKLNELFQAYYIIYDDSMVAGLPYIVKAYYLARDIGYKEGIANSAYWIGSYFIYTHNLIKASQFLFEALKYAENLNDFKLTGQIYQSLGVIYYNQKKWQLAADYLRKCSENYKKSKVQVKASTTYYLSGLCELELGNTELAKKQFIQARNIAEADKDTVRITQVDIGRGRIEIIEKHYQQALTLFRSVIDFMSRSRENVGLAICYENISRCYYLLNQFDSALTSVQKAEQYAKNSAFSQNRMEIAQLFSKIYESLGKYDLALKYMNDHLRYRDSLYQQDVSAQIAVANSNFEFDKVETGYKTALAESKRRKNIFTFLSILLGTVLLIGVVAYRSIRKARRKSEELLLNILPKETAEELKKYGKALPRHHNSVTIMFCDVQRFTAISSSMSPETLVNMLDMYFGKFDDIVSEYGIEKIKTIGDAYMCVCGLTGTVEDHALRMVNAAKDMMKFVTEIEPKVQEEFGNAFHFRIGIHSGNVVSGVVGRKKYAYDIWGDSVNVAARMEQNSEPGKINITRNTLTHLNGQVKVIERGNLAVKNHGTIEMFFLNI